MGYTVTEKGTVTIPVEFRRRLGLKRGSQVDFVDTDEGVLIVPVIPFEGLRGADRHRKEMVHRMIMEIQRERAKEAVET
jgi:AbrB family looped-hinge helix DNA binding protein